MKKLSFGVGYNSKGKHKSTKNGKFTGAYLTWRNMLKRCYDEKNRTRYPSYGDCTIDEKWHDFQDFADWFEDHDYSNMGYQLDKDILHPKNKIYSPDKCCFVPRQLNTLIIGSEAARGAYPQGVSYCKIKQKIKVQMKKDGVNSILGFFDDVETAVKTYKEAKECHVKHKASQWRGRISEDVFDALMAWEMTE